MRRIASVAATLAVLAAGAAPAGAKPTPTLGNWDVREQRSVIRAGIMPVLGDGDFHGERAVAGREGPDALRGLAAERALPAVAGVPSGRLSVFTFDRLLVTQLGLADVAAAVQAEASRAGLRPPAPFGTEVVARMLGLRHDQPFGLDQFELYPWEAITRAEAAWSLARATSFTGRAGPASVRQVLARFALPSYSAREVAALRVAVARIGMPYVWGGETDRRSAFFGGQVHGGYDCSGFAWRIFKLGGQPQGRQITGRTAASQAGEIAPSARVRADAVAPTDLLFFGPGRFWQKATERRINHMGIALSKDFMIHSSSSYGGVSVAPLFTPRRAREFSWGRRLR